MNWRDRENDGAYISFLTLRVLEIGHDFAYILRDIARDFTYIMIVLSHIFFLCIKRLGSVLSSPELM